MKKKNLYLEYLIDKLLVHCYIKLQAHVQIFHSALAKYVDLCTIQVNNIEKL